MAAADDPADDGIRLVLPPVAQLTSFVSTLDLSPCRWCRWRCPDLPSLPSVVSAASVYHIAYGAMQPVWGMCPTGSAGSDAAGHAAAGRGRDRGLGDRARRRWLVIAPGHAGALFGGDADCPISGGVIDPAPPTGR
jgi:hypothetical protein